MPHIFASSFESSINALFSFKSETGLNMRVQSQRLRVCDVLVRCKHAELTFEFCLFHHERPVLLYRATLVCFYRELALLTARREPVLSRERVYERIRYPNVYDSYAEATKTPAFVGGARVSSSRCWFMM